MIESWKEFQSEYDENRPDEPCGRTGEDCADWEYLARYAEENLEKAFKAGFEVASRRFRDKIQQFCDDAYLSMNWDEDPCNFGDEE